MEFAVIHGPNLNLLGRREPALYGTQTLSQIDADIAAWAKQAGCLVSTFQSNHEGELVTYIQSIGETVDGIVINPAAYTHTSVAIRDALVAVGIPAIEVHLSNTDAREPFRHRSMLADIVVGRIMGLGGQGYRLALTGLLEHLRKLELREQSDNATSM